MQNNLFPLNRKKLQNLPTTITFKEKITTYSIKITQNWRVDSELMIPPEKFNRILKKYFKRKNSPTTMKLKLFLIEAEIKFQPF